MVCHGHVLRLRCGVVGVPGVSRMLYKGRNVATWHAATLRLRHVSDCVVDFRAVLSGFSPASAAMASASSRAACLRAHSAAADGVALYSAVATSSATRCNATMLLPLPQRATALYVVHSAVARWDSLAAAAAQVSTIGTADDGQTVRRIPPPRASAIPAAGQCHPRRGPVPSPPWASAIPAAGQCHPPRASAMLRRSR